MIIVPSILTNDPKEALAMISRCEGVVARIQIDIVDGVFAGNRTIDPSALKYIDTNLKLDFHLMVASPVSWVEKCASVGASSIIGQIEMMGSQIDFIKKVQTVGSSVGLAVNLITPVDSLDTIAVSDIDTLLLMSVPAGFGGQKFDDRVYQKIKEVDSIKEKDTTSFKICIDGGVCDENINTLLRMKVDEVAVGKRLFGNDIRGTINALQKVASNM